MLIQYSNVKTHNLKCIDVNIESGNIVWVHGVSGSGKSSLAVDTIHNISECELFQLLGVHEVKHVYDVDGYKNILPSLCLDQQNYNRNPRSTVATYFGLDAVFKKIFSKVNNVSQGLFQFNSPDAACPGCGGAGVVKYPDADLIIEHGIRLSKLPVKNWRSTHKELHQKLLLAWCEENSIDTALSYSDLSNNERELVMNGVSSNKYKCAYVVNGRRRSKTSRYVGPAKEILDKMKSGTLQKSQEKYLGERTCPVCKGKRFSDSSLKYLVHGKNIGDVYGMDVADLLEWLLQIREDLCVDGVELGALKSVVDFLKILVELKLDYICLNRSVPSLSGGELQRLRLAKAINSPFSNFMCVLDEPTSGLHPSEWVNVESAIVRLRERGNTVVVIEHNDSLSHLADAHITLGPGGGRNGGYLVKRILADENNKQLPVAFFPSTGAIEICNASHNNIQHLNCSLPLGSLVGVCGVSGSGKSTLLKSVIPRAFPGSKYIAQTPIRGNAYSITATSLGIYQQIVTLFSELTGHDKDFFVFSSRGRGQCPTCLGKGYLEEESSYVLEKIICPECNGHRFSHISMSKTWNGISIYDLLNKSVDEVLSIVPVLGRKLSYALELISGLGLGYINLFQNTSSLSGGEAQRVKLANAMLSVGKSHVLMLDEPFRGLDRVNIQKIISTLYKQVGSGASIYVTDHSDYALRFCSYIVEMGPKGGRQGGCIQYNGTAERYFI